MRICLFVLWHFLLLHESWSGQLGQVFWSQILFEVIKCTLQLSFVKTKFSCLQRSKNEDFVIFEKNWRAALQAAWLYWSLVVKYGRCGKVSLNFLWKFNVWGLSFTLGISQLLREKGVFKIFSPSLIFDSLPSDSELLNILYFWKEIIFGERLPSSNWASLLLRQDRKRKFYHG